MMFLMLMKLITLLGLLSPIYSNTLTEDYSDEYNNIDNDFRLLRKGTNKKQRRNREVNKRRIRTCSEWETLCPNLDGPRCKVDFCRIRRCPPGSVCRPNYCTSCGVVCCKEDENIGEDIDSTIGIEGGLKDSTEIITDPNEVTCGNYKQACPVNQIFCKMDPCRVNSCSNDEFCVRNPCSRCGHMCCPSESNFDAVPSETNVKVQKQEEETAGAVTPKRPTFRLTCSNYRDRCPPGIPVPRCNGNPCNKTECGESEECRANYCGGCNSICCEIPEEEKEEIVEVEEEEEEEEESVLAEETTNSSDVPS